jgi:hypothetical protein
LHTSVHHLINEFQKCESHVRRNRRLWTPLNDAVCRSLTEFNFCRQRFCLQQRLWSDSIPWLEHLVRALVEFLTFS